MSLLVTRIGLQQWLLLLLLLSSLVRSLDVWLIMWAGWGSATLTYRAADAQWQCRMHEHIAPQQIIVHWLQFKFRRIRSVIVTWIRGNDTPSEFVTPPVFVILKVAAIRGSAAASQSPTVSRMRASAYCIQIMRRPTRLYTVLNSSVYRKVI